VTAYLFDHSWNEELRRLRLLEETFDPGTFRHLEALGVGAGWRCLEVGGGAGSVARWLSERVGPTGHVVVTDVETEFLEELGEPNLEVRRHDIVAEDLEEGAYDLVHTRLVLEHLPDRDVGLKRMATALAPGGVAVVEEFDGWFVPSPCAGAGLFDRGMQAFLAFMRAAGYTNEYGRRLPMEMRSLGLTEVGAEGRTLVALPGTPAMEWFRLSVVRLRDPMVARGVVSEAEVDQVLALFEDDSLCFQYPVLITAWGRRRA
jgi:SAM-dependent methyltransferase